MGTQINFITASYKMESAFVPSYEKTFFLHMQKQRGRSVCSVDQRLCFHYIDNTIPLLPKSLISKLQPFSVAVQPSLCRTWSDTRKILCKVAQMLTSETILCSFMSYEVCCISFSLFRNMFSPSVLSSVVFLCRLSSLFCFLWSTEKQHTYIGEIDQLSRVMRPEDQWSCKRSPDILA